jgi:hypothetical protein
MVFNTQRNEADALHDDQCIWASTIHTQTEWMHPNAGEHQDAAKHQERLCEREVKADF